MLCVQVQSAFKNRLCTGVVHNLTHVDPRVFLEECYLQINKKLKSWLKNLVAVKINIVLCGEFIKPAEEVERVELKYFNTSNHEVLQTSDFRTIYLGMIDDILTQVRKVF